MQNYSWKCKTGNDCEVALNICSVMKSPFVLQLQQKVKRNKKLGIGKKWMENRPQHLLKLVEQDNLLFLSSSTPKLNGTENNDSVLPSAQTKFTMYKSRGELSLLLWNKQCSNRHNFKEMKVFETKRYRSTK